MNISVSPLVKSSLVIADGQTDLHMQISYKQNSPCNSYVDYNKLSGFHLEKKSILKLCGAKRHTKLGWCVTFCTILISKLLIAPCLCNILCYFWYSLWGSSTVWG